jgi:transcriptional regulator GlxA family with amidase domain
MGSAAPLRNDGIAIRAIRGEQRALMPVKAKHKQHIVTMDKEFFGVSAQKLPVQRVNQERMQAVRRWILDHPSRDLTLKTLAEQAGMGVRHFTRVFRRETGATPGDFVEIARVEAARRLLEDSDMMLHQIASRCGFGNADVMRRAFLRRMGTVPSLYRKSFRR